MSKLNVLTSREVVKFAILRHLAVSIVLAFIGEKQLIVSS